MSSSPILPKPSKDPRIQLVNLEDLCIIFYSISAFFGAVGFLCTFTNFNFMSLFFPIIGVLVISLHEIYFKMKKYGHNKYQENIYGLIVCLLIANVAITSFTLYQSYQDFCTDFGNDIMKNQAFYVSHTGNLFMMFASLMQALILATTLSISVI